MCPGECSLGVGQGGWGLLRLGGGSAGGAAAVAAALPPLAFVVQLAGPCQPPFVLAGPLSPLCLSSLAHQPWLALAALSVHPRQPAPSICRLPVGCLCSCCCCWYCCSSTHCSSFIHCLLLLLFVIWRLALCRPAGPCSCALPKPLFVSVSVA